MCVPEAGEREWVRRGRRDHLQGSGRAAGVRLKLLFLHSQRNEISINIQCFTMLLEEKF